MTKIVICMVGLPGAGKSVLAEKLRRKYPQQTVVLDDISVLTFNELKQQLDIARRHPIVIITDPAIIKVSIEQVEKRIKEWFGDAQLGIVLFDNNLEQSILNVAYRSKVQGDKRIISVDYISDLSQKYNSPWLWACVSKNIPRVWVPTYGS